MRMVRCRDERVAVVVLTSDRALAMVGRGEPVRTKRSRSVDAPAISVLVPAEQCLQMLRRVQ